jgi:tetratricopeptide (TPR) repeat protein
MKRWLLPGLLPVLLLVMAPRGHAQPGGRGPVKAQDYLQLNVLVDAGQPRRAAPAFRTALAKNPLDAEARTGLGRALAAMNRCDEATIHLRGAWPTEAWNAKAALSEATCHDRSGRSSEARVALEEAIAMNPSLMPARQQYTRFLIEQGELEAAREQVALIQEMAPDTWRSQVLGLEVAVAAGDRPWEHLFALRAEVDRDPTPQARQSLLYAEGLLWLDAPDPDHAELVLARAVTLDTSIEPIVLWRAEALRRGGFVADARAVAWRRTLRDSPLLHPFRARILLDEGDIEGARAELALAPPNHPETLATAWYIAHTLGEPTETWMKAWLATPHPPARDLMLLVPLESR